MYTPDASTVCAALLLIVHAVATEAAGNVAGKGMLSPKPAPSAILYVVVPSRIETTVAVPSLVRMMLMMSRYPVPAAMSDDGEPEVDCTEKTPSAERGPLAVTDPPSTKT